MPALWELLRNLPADGITLSRGLMLRGTQSNGMWVLGCSRYDIPPASQELDSVRDAIVTAFTPDWVVRTPKPEYRPIRQPSDYTHYLIYRFYWPQEDTQTVWWSANTQQSLFSYSPQEEE